jgi:hypothetical protein
MPVARHPADHQEQDHHHAQQAAQHLDDGADVGVPLAQRHAQHVGTSSTNSTWMTFSRGICHSPFDAAGIEGQRQRHHHDGHQGGADGHQDRQAQRALAEVGKMLLVVPPGMQPIRIRPTA